MVGAKVVWKARVPPRVRFFAWLALQDRCWTAERRRRHGLQETDDCALCDQTVESMEHLMTKCSFVMEIWYKYLIILDDVWTTEVLLKIREVLVDNGRGSRVIITTRIEEVASIAEDSCKIKVEPLNDHDAWLLHFSKTKNHTCPIELHQCGKDIVEKCDGLPLALVAIGSLLSMKRRSVKDWRVFYNQLILEPHNNGSLNHVEKILNLSYKYLPGYLKNCFLYFSLFPEDYPILRKRLIRLWIAEGFIEQKGACSLEDVAESYMGELVKRSLLQVAKCNSFDRMQYLRMHDLVRELAIVQSQKEGFSTSFDDTHRVVQVGMGLDFRRVSVLQCNKGIQPSILPSRHRTFISFDTSMELSSWSSFIFSGSKYITVLDLPELHIEDIPNSIGELFNLRYLCLDDTKVKELPKSITKLHNLQTLSLERTQVLSFPQGFFKLKKLRHLLVWKLLDATYRSFHNWESMEPFEGMWDLKELQSLSEVRATKMFVAKLVDLSQLRSVAITNVRSSHCAQLCNSLSKMHRLTKLHIRAINEAEILLLEDLTLQNPLEKLELVGQLSEGTLESPFFSTHKNQLLQIEISWCQFTESPVAQLSGLSNLTELLLPRAYAGHQLKFHGTWFQKLKSIVLADLTELNQICIQEGALVRLEYIHIDRLKELRNVPTGIEFLNSVKEAFFIRMRSDFVRNLQMAKLNHIPKVYWSTQGKPT
ncbi:hypothetical protein U9M48_014716 [Paspalum notatum var. saurae]|uniref:NB-ARC domain-containing protein n=1 Tax=Paspalum notatum var. saurae TaxID=547442 RepID=A0AAQ3WKZ9_PASNO